MCPLRQIKAQSTTSGRRGIQMTSRLQTQTEEFAASAIRLKAFCHSYAWVQNSPSLDVTARLFGIVRSLFHVLTSVRPPDIPGSLMSVCSIYVLYSNSCTSYKSGIRLCKPLSISQRRE